MIQISSNFPGGNIEVITSEPNSPIHLAIKKDNQSEFKQWFYFCAHASSGESGQFVINNAGECAYPMGWENYSVCCSFDGEDWFRVPTTYRDGQLSFELEFDYPSAYFAYFAPYSYERHQSLVHQCQWHPLVEHQCLGMSLEGRPMNLLKIGNDSAPKKLWFIARQHPGETMAEWFIEGVIGRLLDESDVTALELLERYCFYVVPNMNPDGSCAGHLRTNAIGINLNREWDKASLEKSPEVFYVREKMQETGVDLFIDVHGDEGLPYNFVAACEGIPSYSEEMAVLEKRFINAFKTATPEFQDVYGYEKDAPKSADLSIANAWVGETFGCLSLTLEMPFKDNADHPDPAKGWSPERCQLLGESILQAILNTSNE